MRWDGVQMTDFYFFPRKQDAASGKGVSALHVVRWSHAETAACIPLRVPNARRAVSLARQRRNERRAWYRWIARSA